jgi:hypothetical protein
MPVMTWMDMYDSLAKPSWTPAPSTISLIWMILYPIIVVSFGFVRAFQGKVLRRREPSSQVREKGIECRKGSQAMNPACLEAFPLVGFQSIKIRIIPHGSFRLICPEAEVRHT